MAILAFIGGGRQTSTECWSYSYKMDKLSLGWCKCPFVPQVSVTQWSGVACKEWQNQSCIP